MQWYITKLLKQRMAEALVIEEEGVGPLFGAKLHLGKTDIDISADTTLAALTAVVANFTGYLAKVLTWSAATIGEDGAMQTVGEHTEFRPTDAVTANTIFNCWVTNGDADELYMVGKFDPPGLPMNSALNNVDLAVLVKPDGEIGADIIG